MVLEENVVVLALLLAFSYVIHLSYAIVCDNGDCVFDCKKDDCDPVICTNSATSCLVYIHKKQHERFIQSVKQN